MAKPKAKDKPKAEGTTGAPEDMLEIRKRFNDAMGASSENRTNYINDTRFSCTDDQWDYASKMRRGLWRPALTFNRLNGVIKQIIGDYRQNKIAIKVLPASGDADEDTAEILAGLIRNIEQQSNADMAYAHALECSARGGFGYFRINTEYTGDDVFDQDIVIRPIHNPLTVYMDPAAKLITREDARYCFVTEMMPKAEFKAKYPKAAQVNFDAEQDKYMEDWLTADQVRVAEYFEKVPYQARICAFSNGMVTEVDSDDQVMAMEQIGFTLVNDREAERIKILWKKLSGQAVLEEREYKWKYIPIIPVIGEEINLEGKVYTRSAIFYAKDSQRTYNYSKTTAVELVALTPKAPWLGTPKQFQGFEDQWDSANVSPLSRLTYNPDPAAPGTPQRVESSQQPIGDIAMALGASDDIKATTGIYDASLGAGGNETSGVAIEARQQEGNSATYIFIDNLKKAIQHCGKVILDQIPTVYDTERCIRVIDPEGKTSTQNINELKHNPLLGITEILNNITVGKYDVIIDTGPSFASRRRETQAALVQLISAYPPLMQIAGDLFIKSMDFAGAPEVADRLARTIPPQIRFDPDSPEGQKELAEAAQAQQQQQNQQQQLAAAHFQVEMGKQKAENNKSVATIAKANAEIVKANADVMQAKAGTVSAKASVIKSLADAHKSLNPPKAKPHGNK